jgi:4-oxalomesaconate tautomerase
MWMRGGTSKGAYFLAGDLPTRIGERDDLLLRLLGSPDARQIDGIGGAHPLTSKVAVVSPSPDRDADVDYLFLQVAVEEATVSDRQNCGNLLAGVGPFAIERGLVSGADPVTPVRIRMLNTGGVATARIQTPGGRVRYDGDTAISGVPGSGAPIPLEFAGTAGATCGALLPTGRTVDVFEDVSVTCIDNGMPVLVLRASDLGVRGDETPQELEANHKLREQLEGIRLAAGPPMGLLDVTSLTVPKLCLVSPPLCGGNVCTRSFIPHRCHDAIGVLGAVSVATACLIPGTPGAAVSEAPDSGEPFSCEHPTGSFEAIVELEIRSATDVRALRSGVVRTARKLFDGEVFPR